MPVKIKKIPGPSPRPAPPKKIRWLATLACMVATGILLMRLLGKHVESGMFWWLAIGIPLGAWSIIAFFRVSVFGLRHLQADAYDTQREKYILMQVRRGRRALQILSAECVTAHAFDLQCAPIAEALLRNVDVLSPQTTRDGNDSVRHSRLPPGGGNTVEAEITAAFTFLLQKLAVTFSLLPVDNPVEVLLESSSSFPRSRISALWLQAWQKSGIAQPAIPLTGYGLRMIDDWLDHRINEKSLLLVVALQIAPEAPDMTAEVIVSLLLGNRLTQKTLTPQAFLHRPEASASDASALQEGVLQAADWVPQSSANEVAHLWLSGLAQASDARSGVISLLGRPPLASITQDVGMHDFNTYLGHPGCTAPWLAIAAAAQAICSTPGSHMIISGEQDSEIVWSTAVSPSASRKEINS